MIDVAERVEWWKWKYKQKAMGLVMFGIGPEYELSKRRRGVD